MSSIKNAIEIGTNISEIGIDMYQNSGLVSELDKPIQQIMTNAINIEMFCITFIYLSKNVILLTQRIIIWPKPFPP